MIVFSQLSRDYTLGSQTVRALQEVSGEVFAGEMVALWAFRLRKKYLTQCAWHAGFSISRSGNVCWPTLPERTNAGCENAP